MFEVYADTLEGEKVVKTCEAEADAQEWADMYTALYMKTGFIVEPCKVRELESENVSEMREDPP